MDQGCQRRGMGRRYKGKDMKVGQKVIIVETNQIGTIAEIDDNGQVTKVDTGDKIVSVIDKTVKVLTWLYQLLQFIKTIIKL